MRRPAAACIVVGSSGERSKRKKTAREKQEIWEEEPETDDEHFTFDVPDPEEFPHFTPMSDKTSNTNKWPQDMPKFYTVTKVGPRGGPAIGIHFATWKYIHDLMPPNKKDPEGKKFSRLYGSGVLVLSSFTLRDALIKWVRYARPGLQPAYMDNAPPEELVSTE